MTRDEFNALIERDHTLLMGMARYTAGSDGQPEDLLHTAIVRFCTYESWTRCPDAASLRGYLVVIMKRITHDLHARDERRREELRPFDTTETWREPRVPRDDYAPVEQRAVILTHLRQLPPSWRKILAERYVLDQDIGTTARNLGIATSTVSGATFRSKKILRATMNDPR